MTRPSQQPHLPPPSHIPQLPTASTGSIPSATNKQSTMNVSRFCGAVNWCWQMNKVVQERERGTTKQIFTNFRECDLWRYLSLVLHTNQASWIWFRSMPLVMWVFSSFLGKIYRAVLFKWEFIIQMRAAAKHTLPLLPLLPTLLLPSFSSFPFVSEQNGGPKKASNTQIRGTEGM